MPSSFSDSAVMGGLIAPEGLVEHSRGRKPMDGGQITSVAPKGRVMPNLQAQPTSELNTRKGMGSASTYRASNSFWKDSVTKQVKTYDVNADFC
jgi:hypothetical protein